MLVRRGFQPSLATLDLPFPPDVDEVLAERIAARLGHYAFRLFLRGAILRRGSFSPAEASKYVEAARATEMAEDLVALGMAAREEGGRYRLLHPVRNFGGTLEWYVARELRGRLGFDVAAGVKFHAHGAAPVRQGAAAAPGGARSNPGTGDR